MAQEITVQANLSCTNGSFAVATKESAIRPTQSTQGGGGPGVVSVTTSDAVVTLSNITTPGWIFVKNLDATNYFEIGPTSGGAIVKFIKLMPGEFAVFRLAASVTLRAQANTATCKGLFIALET